MNKFYMVELKGIVDEASIEIQSHINSHWDKLRQINAGFVAVHTWLVLWWAKNHLTYLLDEASAEE